MSFQERPEEVSSGVTQPFGQAGRPPSTMSMAELGFELQISESTVRRMIQAGLVPGVVRIGRSVRISRRVIADWLDAV